MIAFFTISEKTLEALICTAIFIVSILYLVTTYPSVNSTNLFESEDDKFKFDEEDDSHLNEIIANWR
jgi:hypothetical protein